ncbi:hypothetical protein JCM8115_006615 [Rhodotorula mucilaginosa]
MAPAQRSPSPWSRFLSPSLFSQRSTPGQPSATVAPSPLKESTTVPHQPGLFTHAKEINPFERSFAVLEPVVATTTSRNGVPGTEAHAGHGDGMQVQGMDRNESGRAAGKRKRALSSPAVLTPGGSAAHMFAGEGDGALADFVQKAKRPTLSVRNQDSGVGLLDDRDLGSGPYSLRTSVNGSFDSTSGSSLLRHRRGASLSESPDTSVAPSPPSPKQGPSPPALAPPPPNAYAVSHGRSATTTDDNNNNNRNSLPHFQTQPMPFSMPIVPSTTAFAHPVVYSSAPAPIVAATSVAPNAVVPPPTSFGYGADANGPTQFMPPPPSGQLGAGFAPMDPQLQQAYFVPSFSAAGTHLPFDPSLAIPKSVMYPTASADVSIRHQQLYSGYPALPAPPLSPPPPPPPSVAPVNPSAAVVTRGTHAPRGSVAAASMSPVAQGRNTTSHDGARANDRSSVTPVPARLPGPKKRGRKPKNWDPATEQTVELDPEEQEKQRKLALERNRVAASKSRRRKKERVELLENAAAELCTRNVALQAECRTLLAEVHNLRTYMSQAHPQGACSCQHVNGYLAREAEGGGIPAILYGAGKTLERDYTHPPKWGSEDDALAGAIELRALEAITRGGKLGDLPEEDGLAAAAAATGSTTLTTGKATKGKSSPAAGRTASQRRSRDMDVDDLQPVVGRAKGAIPVRGGASASPSAPTRPGMATRGSSSIAVNNDTAGTDATGGGGGGLDSDHDFDDSDGDESEAEHIALKSRRARAISLRKPA